MYSGGPGDSRGSFRGGSAPGSNANIPPNFRDMNGFGSQFDRPRDWGGPYRRDTPFYRDNDRDRDFRGGGGNGAGRGGFRGKRDWTPSREYGMHPGMSFSAGMTPRGSYRDRDDPEATISPKRRRMSRTGARDDLDRDASPMSPPRGASPASILARRSRSPSPSGSGRLSPPPLSLSQNSAPAYGRSRSRSPSGRAPSPDRRGDTSPRHTYNSHTPSHFPPPKDRFTPRPSPHMYYNNNNNNRDRFRDDRGPPRTDRERYSSPSAGGSSPPRAGFTPRNGREPYRFAGTASPMYPRDSEYRPDRDSSSDRQDHRYDRDRDRDRDRDLDRGDRDRDKLRDPPLRDKERPSPSPSPSLTSRSYKDDMPHTPRRDSFTSPANPLAASTPLQLHTPVVSPRLSTSLPSVPPTALLSPTDSPLMSPSALSGSGETTQQRKRLGWGQGLMAIEKKVNPADEQSPVSSPAPLRSPSPPPQASVPLSPQLARSPPFSLGSQAPTVPTAPQLLPATPTPTTPTFTTPLSPHPIAPLGDPSTLNGEPSRNPFNTVGQSPRGAAPPRPWAPPHALSVSTPTGINTMPSNIPAAFLPTTPTSSFAPSPPVTPRDPRLADPRISVSDPRLSTPLAHRQPGPPPPLSLSAQSIEPPSRMSTPPPSMPTPALSVSAPSVLPTPVAEPVVPPLPSKEEVLFKIEKLDMEIAKTENEITQTQRARQQLESSPKRTRAKETESDRSDRPLHEVIYEDNKEKAAQAADDLLSLMPAPVTPTLFQSSIPVTALVVPLRPEDYTEAVENHKLIRSRVASVVRQRVIEANSHMHELADQYKAIARDWKLKCREFEDQRAAREAQRVAAARRRKSNNSAPSSPHMNGGSSTRPALRVGGPTPAIGSPPTRRGGLLGSSDVVHSEAELMEILAQLQEQEENNPDTRYCSALATIPPMVLDDYVADGEGAGEGAMGRRKFYDQNGYVEDCLALERARKQTSIWNEEDKALFVKKYLQYPKNFKRIASFFPDRNTEEMVAFYYANKKTLNLKRLLKQSQTRRGGRGPRKSITEPASTSAASHSSSSGSTNTTSSSNNNLNTASTVSRELVGLGSASPLTSNYWGSVSAERPGRNAFRPPIIPAQQLDESEDDYIGSPPSTPGMRRTSVNSSGDDLSNSGGLGLDGLRWTDTEKDQFLVAIRAHGRDFKSIAEQVGTRTISQCKNYYHSNKKKLQLDNIIEQRERRAFAVESAESDEVTPAESDTKGGAAQEKEKPKNKKSVPEAKRKVPSSSATTIPTPSPVAPSAPAVTTASAAAAAVTIPSTPTSAPAPIPPASVDVAPVPAVSIPSAAPASVASPPASTSADAMSDSASSPAAPKAPRVVSYWTPLEKQEFLKYLALYGKNWKVLAEHITGKTQNQIKNYFQNYKVKLNLNDLLENTKEEREANKARAAPPSAADLARKKRKKEGDAPSPTPSQLSSSTSPIIGTSFNAEEQTPTVPVPVRILSTQTAPQGLVWPVEMKQEAVPAAPIPAAPQPTVVYSPPVVVPAAAPFVVSTLSPRNEQESMLADLLTTMSDRAAQDIPAPAPSAQLDAAPSGPSDPSLEPAPTTSEDPSSVDAAAALATLAALAPPDASIPLEVEAVVPVPAPLEVDPELQTSLLEEIAQAAAEDVSMEDAPIFEFPVLDVVTTPPTLPPPTMQQEEQTNLPLADPADTTSVDIDISTAPSEDNILDDTAAPPLSPLPNTITSEMGEDTLSPPMPAMHDTVPPTDLSASDNLEPLTIMETDSNVSLETPLGEALPVPAGGDDWQCADISHTDDPVETTPVLVSTEEQGSTDQPSLREESELNP